MKSNRTGTVKEEKQGFLRKIRRAISGFIYNVKVKIHKAFTKNRKPKLRKLSGRGGKIFYWVMFALPLLQFAVFYVGVNFNSIMLAFKETVLIKEGATIAYVSRFTGFETLKKFITSELTSASYLVAVKNSLIYLAFSLVAVIPLGLLFSFYIFKKYPLGGFFRTFLFLPSVICSLILVIFYSYICDNAIPEIMFHITGVRREGLLANANSAFPALIFFNFLFSFGPSSLVYVNAMTQIEPSVIEAAELDGATGARQFARIVLPLIFPSITSYVIICIAQVGVNQLSGFSFFGPYAGESNCQSIGYMLFTKVLNNAEENYPIAAAGGVFFTLIIAPLTLALKWILEKFGPSED